MFILNIYDEQISKIFRYSVRKPDAPVLQMALRERKNKTVQYSEVDEDG